jgi:hypothetical protein
MRISGPWFLVKGGDAVLMLRSVESKYDGFMTWQSRSHDFQFTHVIYVQAQCNKPGPAGFPAVAEQGKKTLVNTRLSATVKV